MPEDTIAKYDQAFFIQLARQGSQKWNAWRKKNPDISVDFKGVDFTQEEYKVDSFSGFHFGAGANFREATFGDLADFRNSTFEERADFHNSTFGERANFICSTFGIHANFRNLTFGEKAGFEGSTFGTGATFFGSTFGERANFIRSRFGEEANFSGSIYGVKANFSDSTFGAGADFGHSIFGEQANFRNSTIGERANFSVLTFGEQTNFRGSAFGAQANFADSIFGERADFRNSSFGDNLSLINTLLDGADFRGAKNLQFDGTSIRHARFDDKAADHWSVLRRTYTGPRLAFTLFFLVLFIAPYGAKVAYWKGVNEYQKLSSKETTEKIHVVNDQASDNATESILPSMATGLTTPLTKIAQCGNTDCTTYNVWQLTLGVDRGKHAWMLAVALILFNALKALVTIVVIPMREQEERSGYCPNRYTKRTGTVQEILKASGGMFDSIQSLLKVDVAWGYEILYKAHRVIQILFYLAIGSFLFNLYKWLFSEVQIPTMS